MAAKFKKEIKTLFRIRNLQKSKARKTPPRILKYQPTNARKDRAKCLGINTGKHEQQLINANPISRAVLWKLVSPVIRGLKRFRFLMTDECQSEQMRSSKAYGFIAHGNACQCIKNKYCLGKQAFHTASFLLRSHSSVP